MIILVVEMSKYILTLLMAIYMIQCFSIFGYKNDRIRHGVYFRQNVAMILIHMLSFIVMFLQTEDVNLCILYFVQQITIIAILVLYRLLYKHANRLILNNMCMLITISFIILARLSYVKARKQLLIVIAAVIITLIIPGIMMKFKNIRRFYLVFAVIGVVFLGTVLLFSQAVNGSKLNFSIMGISFQPSEYVKLLFVFAIAGFLSKSNDFKSVAVTACVAGLHVIILVLSKDLGSAIIYFVVYIIMIYVATHKIRYIGLGMLGAVLGSIIGYKAFHHVRVRVKAFTDPFGTIDNEGYQIAQSLFAIGTGGFFGMGLFQGAPERIPVVTSDFVFAAITEELGVIFALCMILVCVSCFVMFMNISMRFKDEFYKLVGVGLAITYGFQVFLAIGGVTKFIPLTGVTLPLVSYGGNSVFVSLIMFSVIQGLYVTRREFE